MCGRYSSHLPPDLLARIFRTVNPFPNVELTWNMAPTRTAPVVRLHPETAERYLDVLTWGLVPWIAKTLKGAPKPINARSETVASSPMFKSAFTERRFLVPAAAYYEWRDDPDGKTPFAVARVDGDPLAFAGIDALLRPAPGDVLRLWPVDKRVGNVRNDGPDLLKQVKVPDPAEPLLL